MSDSDTSSSELQEISIDSISRKRNAQQKTTHISSKTARDRAITLNNPDIYADGNVLFCKPCSKALDHRRLGTIKRHLKSTGHIEKSQSSNTTAKRQKTLQTSFCVQTEARFENIKTVTAFVKMLASANIPFNSVNNPHVREFLREHVKGGGAIPQRAALTNYLNDIVNTDRSKLKKELADKQLQLFVDETFDKHFAVHRCFSAYAAKTNTYKMDLAVRSC